MQLKPLDRMTAIILAKTICDKHDLLDLTGELDSYIQRLFRYRLFTVAEISAFANISEYRVRKALIGEPAFTARSGIQARHLDHIIRMIGSNDFAKAHIHRLLEDGATTGSLARVTGISDRNLRRWAKKEEEK